MVTTVTGIWDDRRLWLVRHGMELLPFSLDRLVDDFASALNSVDADGPRGPCPGKRERFKPGLGPLDEVEAVRLAAAKLKAMAPDRYHRASTEARYPATLSDGGQRCDLVIPERWAIEVKMLRPYRDNGDPEPAWAKDVLSPYECDGSAIIDAMKLARSGFEERKAVVIYGLAKADDPDIDLDLAVKGFELIVNRVVGPLYGSRLSPRCSTPLAELMHPVHQVGVVFAWEVLGAV